MVQQHNLQNYLILKLSIVINPGKSAVGKFARIDGIDVKTGTNSRPVSYTKLMVFIELPIETQSDLILQYDA